MVGRGSKGGAGGVPYSRLGERDPRESELGEAWRERQRRTRQRMRKGVAGLGQGKSRGKEWAEPKRDRGDFEIEV